ncbi:MAG: AI-2E family transporter [Fimbriimonadales bacterium]
MYTVERYRKYGFAAMCVVLLLLAIYIILPIWTGLAWGAILAVLVYPIHRRYANRFSPSMAALITTIFTLIAIVLPLIGAGFAGANELNTTLRGAKSSLETTENLSLMNRIDRQFEPALKKLGISTYTLGDCYESLATATMIASPGISQQLTLHSPTEYRSLVLKGNRASDYVKQAMDPAIKAAPQAARTLIKTALLAALALILLFFAVRDGHRLRQPVLQLLPLAKEEGERIMTMIYDTIHATFFGVVLIAFVNGFLIALIYYLLGIPAPMLFAILTTIVSFVPIAGPPFVWIPTAIWLASQGEWWKAILLAILGLFFIGLTVDKLYRSYLIGSRINLHSMVVMFSLLGGMFVLGPIGAFIGPVVVILTIAALEVLREIGREAT